MIDTPEIVRTSDQLTAYIHITIPRHEISTVMGPGISELMTTVGAQGIAVTGPWFTHHLTIDPEVFDFEISVPVSAPVTPDGRVEGGVLPAALVARTVYRGGYEGLGPAWEEFDAWVISKGYRRACDLWEVYVAGPETGSDESGWQTQLNRPLIVND